MADQRYTVRDVQSLTGVRPRTIRYWIRKRLIARPTGRGRAARYTETHVLRIRVVHQLRGSRVSLNAIRTRIAALNDDQLRGCSQRPRLRERRTRFQNHHPRRTTWR